MDIEDKIMESFAGIADKCIRRVFENLKEEEIIANLASLCISLTKEEEILFSIIPPTCALLDLD